MKGFNFADELHKIDDMLVCSKKDFLYMDNDAWHWCMQSRRDDMTQYKEKVANRKQELEQEKHDNTIIAIDTRYNNGKWTEQTIWYASGKKITEFADKRKSVLIEE